MLSNNYFLFKSPKISNNFIRLLRTKKNFSNLSSQDLLKYEKKSPREHILMRPGMYIGQVNPTVLPYYLLNSSKSSIKKENVPYIPGLLKIFDEVLINASDNYIRSNIEMKDNINKMTYLNVNIDKIYGTNLLTNNKLTNKNDKNENSNVNLDEEIENLKKDFIQNKKKFNDDILQEKLKNLTDLSNNLLLKITIQNNGNTIPIELHPTEKIYIPELIFGHLLTGTNFDDNTIRLTGGSHGYGAKLTNIFSKKFSVEICNNNKIYYQEWNENMKICNEPIIKDFNHLKIKKENYTKISFIPDLKLFNLPKLDKNNLELVENNNKIVTSSSSLDSSSSNYIKSIEEIKFDNNVINNIIKIFERRIYDLSASFSNSPSSSSKNLTLKLNNEKIQANSLVNYANLFYNSIDKNLIENNLLLDYINKHSSTSSPTLVDTTSDSLENKLDDFKDFKIEENDSTIDLTDSLISCNLNDNWSFIIAPSLTKNFESISFVNNVNTTRGGTHVNIIMNQINKYIENYLINTKKLNLNKNFNIKNNFFLFLNTNISNPHFEGQSKDALNTPFDLSKNSDLILPQSFYKKLEKSLILKLIENDVKNKNKIKENNSLKKKLKTINITRLEDAKYAGSSNSSECTLLLTEGDSAKALAVAGLSVVGRDYYGVMPLKGKILNVRNLNKKTIVENEELMNLFKAIGLDFSLKYDKEEDFATLRYGKIMFMCDQDYDGSHIKGLLLNFFEKFWPNLLEKYGFLQEFITPIVKVKFLKKKTSDGKYEERSFFSLQEYQKWYDENVDDRNNFNIKYYKGLGTSTANEAREYFQNIDLHRKIFTSATSSYYPTSSSFKSNYNELIDLAFNKDRANDRKDWLISTYNPNNHRDYSNSDINYKDFIENEFIHFSYQDNIRSIPSIIDGLKPSQRKVLYGYFSKFGSNSSYVDYQNQLFLYKSLNKDKGIEENPTSISKSKQNKAELIEFKELEIEYTNIKKQYEKLKDELIIMKEKNNQYEYELKKLKDKEIDINEAIDLIYSTNSSDPSISKLKKKLKLIKEKIIDLKLTIEDHDDKLIIAKNKLKDLEKKYKKLDKEYNNLKTSLKINNNNDISPNSFLNRNYQNFMANLKKSFKLVDYNEIKVIQIAGYISEKTSYHHGEQSLHSTIINMAADYLGSGNNLPYLEGIGQFGTRFMNGKDYASPRYIFSSLSSISRLLFPFIDEELLKNNEDDGEIIEPMFYVPILPTILLNSSSGIGTGWSTYIPSYNIDEIINIFLDFLYKTKDTDEEIYLKENKLLPYFNGFAGEICRAGEEDKFNDVDNEDDDDNNDYEENNEKFLKMKSSSSPTSSSNFNCYGNIIKKSKYVYEITEIPIQTSIQEYKNYLSKLLNSKYLTNIQELHGINDIKFIITISDECYDEFKFVNFTENKREIMKKFKLKSNISLNNIHAFNSSYSSQALPRNISDESEKDSSLCFSSKIQQYSSPEEIINEFYKTRYHFYEQRKKLLIIKNSIQYKVNRMKSKFINDVISGEINLIKSSSNSSFKVMNDKDLSNKMKELGYLTEEEIYKEAYSMNDLYSPISSSPQAPYTLSPPSLSNIPNNFNYLINLPLKSLTQERLKELEDRAKQAQDILEAIQTTSPKEMWIHDLELLKIGIEQLKQRGKK